MERYISGPEKKQLLSYTNIPSKLCFLIEGEMKTFYNKQKIKEFMITKPALKGLLHTKEEIRVSQENARRNNPL
jgi:hypothetical protein